MRRHTILLLAVDSAFSFACAGATESMALSLLRTSNARRGTGGGFPGADWRPHLITDGYRQFRKRE
jgi:hypothetical protein